jgi:CPA1 family monovalent cation:H+ antiporter
MHLEVSDGLVELGLILAIATMLVIAPALRVPYPILLVVGGLVLGLVPGMPELELPPELVFFGVLPPLLYGAAFFTSLRDLRASARPITALAVGLVVATTVGVAVVAHAFVDGLSWGSAFVLGAIVSPTDPLAATSIARRLGVPRKLVTIVEGESLVNDGTGLVAYRVAVVAVISGRSLLHRRAGCSSSASWAASAWAWPSAGSCGSSGAASTTRRRRSRSRSSRATSRSSPPSFSASRPSSPP